jgi:hypothetical protein
MENKDFAIFIMVHGRPQKNTTLDTLKKCNYTGKVYLVADNLDDTLNQYIEIYGDMVLVFDKGKAMQKYDSGDNTGDVRSTMFAANEIFNLAEMVSVKYFFIMCDDYFDFYYAFSDSKGSVWIKNIDKVFDLMVDYYKKIPALSIAFAQTGDFIGGIDNGKGSYRFSKRKAMNTFLCSTERRFEFAGRLNEDVTTYVNLGSKGELFLTIPVIALGQKDTQQQKKGLTEAYLDNGTYVKSMFSVIYNPSCVKASMMNANHKRIHHSINWKSTTPMIISDKYKKYESNIRV